jgi:PhnB protein
MPEAKPSPIPDGQPLLPCLIVRQGARALDFYRRAFGATELFRLDDKAGDKEVRVGHAELSIGAARFAVADEYPELGYVGPATLGNTSVVITVYVADVDAFAARAVAEGAIAEGPITNEFYGDRIAKLKDPFGHRWIFASRIEVVSPDEMKRRMAAG